MYPSYGGYEDYSGYLYHTAYVETAPRIYTSTGILTTFSKAFPGGRVQVPISRPILQVSPAVPTGLLIR